VTVHVVLQKPVLTSLGDVLKNPPISVIGVYADEAEAAKLAGRSPDAWYVSVPFIAAVVQ